jgi:MurNAc alpha-1-phosphate uridylyltransferase
MAADTPKTAMVLSAGLGLRMRPLTETCPKPLIRVGGKPLIDWSLDLLEKAGVEKSIVNVHHLSGMMLAHLDKRISPKIVVSDERERLLDSGGGIVKALPELGEKPFFALNADTFWIDEAESNLKRMAEAWDPKAMDMLLLLAPQKLATGHNGGGDFFRDGDGRLSRARGAADAPIYAGAAIISPEIFAGAPSGPHSLNIYFDRAIEKGRLFGLELTGRWITVGTPDAIAPAEKAVARLASLVQ